MAKSLSFFVVVWVCVCLFFLKTYLSIYLSYVYEYTITLLRHTRRGHQVPFTDGCEPPHGCWDLNSGSLEEQSVFLTSEPSVQPLKANILLLSTVIIFNFVDFSFGFSVCKDRTQASLKSLILPAQPQKH